MFCELKFHFSITQRTQRKCKEEREGLETSCSKSKFLNRVVKLTPEIDRHPTDIKTAVLLQYYS